MFAGIKGEQICGAEKIKCYKDAESKLFGEDIIDGLDDENARLFRKECSCWPSCSSIAYEAEIDRTQIDLEATRNSFNISMYPGYGMRFIITFKWPIKNETHYSVAY